MVWGKKNDRTQPEAIMETPLESETRSKEMNEETYVEPAGLQMAVEAAQRFLVHADKVGKLFTAGADEEAIQKDPTLRRLKRASLDLSSELVIMRKELP